MSFAGLVALFVFLPIIELGLLMKVAEMIGWQTALAIVIVTGVLGASLAKFQGMMVLSNMRRDMAQGRLPAPHLLDGVMILLAGALLVTPGLVTDTVGFLLLVPAARAVIKAWLRKKLESKLRQRTIEIDYSE